MRPDHHRAPARDAWMRSIILASIRLAKSHRFDAPEDEADCGAAAIVDQAAVMQKAQFSLGLSNVDVSLKRLIQCLDKSGFHLDIIIEEKKMRCCNFVD